MVFNVTLNNISAILWRSVLLVKETGVPGKNHVSQVTDKLYHIIHLTMNRVLELTTSVMIATDCTNNCKSNYYTIMAAPF